MKTLMPGDVVMIDFASNPGRSVERRTAVILSPHDYNMKTGCALACPVVPSTNGYPFAVPLADGSGLKGAVLADFVRRIDWQGRHPSRVGRVDEATLAEILGRLRALLNAHL